MKRIMGWMIALLVLAGAPALAQGISQKVAVCNPSFTNRCIAPDANGAIPVTGSLSPSGTQNVNVAQVGGNAVTTSLPVSDAGGSLTVDTLQLPASLGQKTAASSLSITPSSDGVWPLPTGASTSALQTAGNASLSSIDTKLTAPLSIQGNVASLATDSGNPIKTGCVFLTTRPTATNGQRIDCQSTSRGEALVTLSSGTTVAAIGAINASLVAPDGLTTRSQAYLYDGTNNLPARGIVGVDGSGNGVIAVAMSPISVASASLTPTVSAAVTGSTIFKASAGNLYSVSITTGGTGGYLMLFNSTTVPADGAVTPQQCLVVGANSSLTWDGVTGGVPERYTTGIVGVFSSTGCFTKTISATAFLRAKFQ